MTTLEQDAARRGIMRAFLGTSDFQARPFYEQLGYSVVGSYTLTEQFNNHIMVKQLEPTQPQDELFEVTINPDEQEIAQLQLKLHVYNSEYPAGLDSQQEQAFLGAIENDLVRRLFSRSSSNNDLSARYSTEAAQNDKHISWSALDRSN
jgi:hypothetical protein